jgi:hypothetical protein
MRVPAALVESPQIRASPDKITGPTQGPKTTQSLRTGEVKIIE